ncbi:MAPEG family protein [Sulfitobacter sp. F26169L]|uniref:MAPEG family protein n=1 Tax=Sulfitobacter sp. F26169L TaxID=2996015 RepID=UPI002260BFC6|nr:MAPEG family protein [Sulfitobacter sp. F26169L]MCX7566354.1 MAPEG family protein [Sulfitobacter sp. F26169L]
MMLTITPLYAALLALVFIVLAVLVVRERIAIEKAPDGADETALNKSMRVHANFVEYVPLALVLMICAELQGAPVIAVHAMGATLLIGRVCHGIGMSSTPQIRVLRAGGFLLTSLMLIFSSLAVLVHALL